MVRFTRCVKSILRYKAVDYFGTDLDFISKFYIFLKHQDDDLHGRMNEICAYQK